jgi:hypothetical protein
MEVPPERADETVAMETDWMTRITYDTHVEKRTEPTAGEVQGLVFKSAECDKVNARGGDGSSRGKAGGGGSMPQAYAQCRAAREVELKKGVVEISAVPNFGCEAGEYLKNHGQFYGPAGGCGGMLHGGKGAEGWEAGKSEFVC